MKEREKLILAIPAGPRVIGESPRHSEGSRLAEPTHRFLHLGVGLDYHMPPDQYYSGVERPLIELAEFKGANIPGFVARGIVHLGIVGLDHVLNLPDGDLKRVIIERKLGYGKCEFRLGVPIPENSDGQKIYDSDSQEARAELEDLRSLLHLRNEEVLRVATALPTLAERIFNSRNIGVIIVPMDGHVENAIRYGMADAIVDIVQSGGTMIRNGIAPAETLESFEAVLISNSYPLRGKERVRNSLLKRVDRALNNPNKWISSNNVGDTLTGVSINGHTTDAVRQSFRQAIAS